ncbi:hypothetical protein [Anaerocolumna sp.]|uniref:hypothetical protein n=1 Tax=Anaerocolumna sp. TaxID=2041569 RepID=UPI0028AB8A23|nr:hypothetical protein [Anaerocolumna sp.]
MKKLSRVISFLLLLVLLFPMSVKVFAEYDNDSAYPETKLQGKSTLTEPVMDTITLVKLTDGMTLLGSKLTFDVIARDSTGAKIWSTVTINGRPVRVGEIGSKTVIL